MKLTLEHLCCYLPYGLKIKAGVQYIATMSAQSGMDEIGIMRVLNQTAFKPILRPFSDLHKPIIESNNLILANYLYRHSDVTDLEFNDSITDHELSLISKCDLILLIGKVFEKY